MENFNPTRKRGGPPCWRSGRCARTWPPTRNCRLTHGCGRCCKMRAAACGPAACMMKRGLGRCCEGETMFALEDMSEREWQYSDDPERMMLEIGLNHPMPRKSQLFVCACARL